MTTEAAVTRCRGFSLIELVVALAILALLLAAVVPSAAVWIRNTRIRTAAETLSSGLQFARTEAIRRNARVGLWLVSLSDPKRMDDSCALASTSVSWVINSAPLANALASPAKQCATAPSATAAPYIIRTYAAGDSTAVLSLQATQSDGTAASSVVFDGFGQVVAPASGIARITVGSATGSGYRALRLDISPTGQIRMCDPALSDTTDPRACP